MCEPSTSASVITITLWYRSFSRSNSSPMPVPIAVIIAWISMFESTLLMRFFSLLMIFPRSGRIAWKPRSRPCLAEPPAESPSTMKSSADSGSLIEQSASLPGRDIPSSADFRRVSSRALRAASRARDAAIALLTIWRASVGFSSRNSASLALTVDSTRPLIARVPELRLRLPLELRVLELDRDHGREALADVLALEVVLLLLQEALVARVLVQRPGERGAESLHVGAALDRVDVVREREHRLLVGGVPLHRDLDLARLGLVLEVGDVPVDGVLGVVDVRDEVLDAAVVVELDALAADALVDDRDPEPPRQERGLAEPLDEGLRRELELLEDLRVRQERDRGSRLLADADGLHARPAGSPRANSCL